MATRVTDRQFIVGIPQGTPEWFALRLGKPSASKTNEILGSGEGHKKYIRQLIGERMTGKPEETFKNGHMKNGNRFEHLARCTYSAISGMYVQQITTVVVTMDDGSIWVASPDGLVGDEGIVEIKFRIASVHLETVESQKVPAENRKQIMSNLLATDRTWCDYVSFCLGLPPCIIRVERNLENDEMIETGMIKFNQELNEYQKTILEK